MDLALVRQGIIIPFSRMAKILLFEEATKRNDIFLCVIAAEPEKSRIRAGA